MKIIKGLIFFIMLFSFSLINFSNINDYIFAEMNVQAKAMCLIESSSLRKLYKKNDDYKLPMASTTKIVTALTVLNNCNEEDLDKEFVINNKAVGVAGTSIYLKENEVMTIRELLYGMMLPSGNDAATALAYHIAKDIPSFCKLMQQTANACGAYNSSFQNPHGLDENNHYTTAYDLALITARALDNKIFKEIVTTKTTRIRGSELGTYRYLKNKNKLLNTLDGCIGVKTGFTNKAGRCLVSACDRNGVKTICVVLNCGPMFEESAQLINKAYIEYKNITILPSYKIARPVKVNNGVKQTVKTFTKKKIEYPLTESEKGRIIYKYNLPNYIDAPVLKDKIIGNVEIYLDNELLFCEKIYTMDNIKRLGVWSSIKDIISQW